jgi:Reverse transcriptase (RNA-dependent DNA polymerase).
MNGPNSEGFWEASVKEISTLQTLRTWTQVKKQPWMNVISSTWAFKIKRFPDGLIRKLKARFCVRGDQQIEGVDFFDTFAPVVQWSTVRILLILSITLKLATKQVDYVSAFCQAPIEDDVYIDLPRGWQTLNELGIKENFKPGHVLKLNRGLYGLRQSPRNFFCS